MLYSVPDNFNKFARNVVMTHPNSMPAVMYRKTNTRPDEKLNSVPSMGGIGVLSSTDEEQFDYNRIGPCRVLPAEPFQAAPMAKSRDANIGAVDEYRFMIEPLHPSGHAEWFLPKNHDVFYLLLTGDEAGPSIAFEIVAEETTSNIPPFTQRYVCNRRDELLA